MRWRTEGSDFQVKQESKRITNEQFPYVSICRKCGLSWRASLTGVRKEANGRERVKWGFGKKECVCGCKPSGTRPWAGFKIKEQVQVDASARALFNALKEELNAHQVQ